MRSGGLIDPDKAAELLETRDPALFSERLLEAAHASVGVEELFAFRIDDGRPPLMLASSSGLGDADERTRAYVRRFHRSDPAVAAELDLSPAQLRQVGAPAVVARHHAEAGQAAFGGLGLQDDGERAPEGGGQVGNQGHGLTVSR